MTTTKSGAEKPRIAFFDFACCEGCQLTVLRLNHRLFDLMAHVDIVAWREVMTGGGRDFDIAFCEGSIIYRRDIDRIRRIRDTARILVSLGSCAGIGCHNALKRHWSTEKLRECVYGDPSYPGDVIPARPITAAVTVDYQVLGCPASMPELEEVLKKALTGQAHRPPNEPVCVECKRNDTLCVAEKGMVCLGPVTRCGCGAICTRFGGSCRGCRGLIDDANLEAAVRVLTADSLHPIMHQVKDIHGLSEEEVRLKFSLYDNRCEPEEKPAHAHQD